MADFHGEQTQTLENSFVKLEYLAHSARIVRFSSKGKPNMFADLGLTPVPTPYGNFFFRGGHDRIIFASNLNDPRGRNFDLYAVHLDGTGLTQITFNPTFDGFPMFSPDGKKLAFCSNRHNAKPGETNVFVADWVP